MGSFASFLEFPQIILHRIENIPSLAEIKYLRIEQSEKGTHAKKGIDALDVFSGKLIFPIFFETSQFQGHIKCSYNSGNQNTMQK